MSTYDTNTASQPILPHIRILGIRVSLLHVAALLDAIGESIRTGKKMTVASGNVHAFNIANRCIWYRFFMNRAQIVRLDGAGLQLAGRIQGHRTVERNTWADFAWALAEYAESHKLKLFFFGGRPGVAEAAAIKLRSVHPSIQIVGTQHGYIDLTPQSGATRALIETINATAPDILICGLGMPRQEAWITHHREAISAPVVMTAGAVFDYVSGYKRRAPSWMQRSGTEWLYRLLQEPGRMWKRYVIGNPAFVLRVVHQRLTGYYQHRWLDEQMQGIDSVLEQSRSALRIPRIQVMGLPLDLFSPETLLARILQLVREKRKSVVANVNMYAVNIASRQPWFHAFLSRSRHVFCDGFAVILAARTLCRVNPRRLTYADWLPVLACAAKEANMSIYLLGSLPGVAERAAEQLKLQAPGLRIAGTHHGYFDKTTGGGENLAVLRAIDAAQPDVLLVGFGMPLQERWIDENWDRIAATVIMPCGAALEYMAGDIRRAPDWMTRHGLEWLGRVLIQPRRLWKRYARGVPEFLWRLQRAQRQKDDSS